MLFRSAFLEGLQNWRAGMAGPGRRHRIDGKGADGVDRQLGRVSRLHEPLNDLCFPENPLRRAAVVAADSDFHLLRNAPHAFNLRQSSVIHISFGSFAFVSACQSAT